MFPRMVGKKKEGITMLKINTKRTIEIAADVDGFLVPGCFERLDTYTKWDAKRINQSLISSGMLEHMEENPWIAQLWFTSKEDLHSENLADHGFAIDLEGRSLEVYGGMICDRVPVDVIRNKTEGDVLEWTCHAEGRVGDEEVNVVLHMNIRFNQRGYRYARYGNFENCFHDTMHRSIELHEKMLARKAV